MVGRLGHRFSSNGAGGGRLRACPRCRSGRRDGAQRSPSGVWRSKLFDYLADAFRYLEPCFVLTSITRD